MRLKLKLIQLMIFLIFRTEALVKTNPHQGSDMNSKDPSMKDGT